MSGKYIDKKQLDWEGPVFISSYTKDYSDELIEMMAGGEEVLHIHYGCDYLGIRIAGTYSDQGCFYCYERQFNINNSLRIEKCESCFCEEGELSDSQTRALNRIAGAIVKSLSENEANRKFTYFIRYKDYSVNRIKVRKLEDCKCCGSKVDDYAWILNMDEEFFEGEDGYRVHKNVNLDAIKDMTYNRTSGLFQYIYKYYRSNYIPIICSEFNDVVTGRRIRSFGRSFSMSGVESSSILEGLERYSGMIPRKRRSIVHERYKTIKDTGINPEKFILNTGHDIEKFGLKRYSSQNKYNWIWAYSWNDKKPVLIPEQIAYYDVNKDSAEKRFVYETSNGASLGGSRQEAVLYGLYELIERDAFLLAWFNRYKPVKISTESIRNEKILDTIRLVEMNGYKVHIFDITTENRVPAVWVLLENPSPDAGVRSYSAAGAHTNPYKAIEGGLVEAITSMPIYESILPEQAERAHLLNRDFSQVTMMEDHVLMYSVPESFERLRYLFENEVYKDIDELYPEWEEVKGERSLTVILTSILDRIAQYHPDIIFVDQTNDLIEGQNLFCAKVIIPTMQNMYFGEQFKRLNVERIRWGAVQAGWRDIPLDEKDISNVPHPFP
ncbi:MAG: YcaO-like family protein [Lachnospiraceae bacterium]|nr:YcaO-like family protein [Lachnospiraceae bacterium]